MNALLIASLLLTAEPAPDRPCVILVVGAAGADEFGAQFATWADRWAAAAEQGDADLVRIGGPVQTPNGDTSDHEILRTALEERAAIETLEPLWLVLIGHGTFDGREAKFNLRGPDLTSTELADWLQPARRPVAVINCASCSAPFVNRLSAPGRVVVTATKSGQERNFARFGDYLSTAIADPAADLDKDRQISLLEAFLSASLRVDEFYQRESRLATEHAMIDDNGDSLGTRAEWFRGVRAVKAAKDGAELDGLRANQLHLVCGEEQRELSAEARARRDQIEAAIEQLRLEKPKLGTDAYYSQLEPLLVELAELYEEAER